jgi:dTDP-4-dehydrorhamnose reductase
VKVLITGASGQVGWELAKSVPNDVEAVFLGSRDLDITQRDMVAEIVNFHRPQIIINAAAFTAVDRAEDAKDSAFAVNAFGAEALAFAANKVDCTLIHISTDFVFDGTKSGAYLVSDVPNPRSVYGISKAEGERLVRLAQARAIIIRTSWVYSTHGSNFVKTMIDLMNSRERLSVVNDQFGCPTYAQGLAKNIWGMVSAELPGAIYHLTDIGSTSWYEFAVEIQRLAIETKLLAKKISIEPISSEAYFSKAPRPKNSVLDTSQNRVLNSKYSLHWKDSLENMIKSLAN